MPGLYTHNVIFRKALDIVSADRKGSCLNSSVEALFSSPAHMRAGLFGALGPNIFDYTELISRGKNYGNDISFWLHDAGSADFFTALVEKVRGCQDSRNEWASVQRAYLMGFASHLISDALIHPYVFYSSGFPSASSGRERGYYREANLMFQYNIDNYFIYRDEKYRDMELNVEQMLPVIRSGRREYLQPSIKVLLLSVLKDMNPQLFASCFGRLGDKKIDGDLGRVRGLDTIPGRMRLCYRAKRSSDPRFRKYYDLLRRKIPFYSDFLVPYPPPKRVDEDALNLHQSRWQYPAEKRGFRYDSVLHLIKAATESTAAVWVELESMVFGNDSPDISGVLQLNAYTGEEKACYRDMKIKDPVRLRF